MPSPAPLPPHLRTGPITQQALIEAGCSRDRILRSDLVKLHRGKYDAVHLSQPLGTTRRIRRAGVRGHRIRLAGEDLGTICGALVTTAARTWLDLAPRAGVEELAVLGDQLVRQPYFRFEGRKDPLASLDELHQVIDRCPRAPGRPRAVEALGRIRVGSDSAAETLLRLTLVGAGLPDSGSPAPPAGQSPALGWAGSRLLSCGGADPPRRRRVRWPAPRGRRRSPWRQL